MADRVGSEALSRLAALGRVDAGPGAANKSLLMLLALGRLAAEGIAETPWSLAEVALADLIGRFGHDPGAAEAGAARVFTGLVADQVWVLDTDIPAQGVRPRALNAWRVAGRLAPDLEQTLRSRPELIGEVARALAERSFAPGQAENVLEAVGLLEAPVRPADPPAPAIPGDRAQHRRGAGSLDDYLKLTVSQAREQFRMLLGRRPVAQGVRQADFMPVETLLCLAASFRVNHRRYGGSTAHLAPEPVPELARLFARRPSSVLAKMANLDGSRSHGAAFDASAGATLREQPTLFTHIYRVLLYAARAEGIGHYRLPDFLGLEDGGEMELLGQEELGGLDPDDLADDRADGEEDQPLDRETERIRAAAARVGQHVFAQHVLSNCGGSCVFCGLRPSTFGGRRMLLAGHIKPWRDSSHRERLDLSNGLAACPSHDVAFDTGLLTVEDDLRITLAASLSEAVRIDLLARQYYGSPPMLTALLLPQAAQRPRARYLDWHRGHVFADRHLPAGT